MKKLLTAFLAIFLLFVGTLLASPQQTYAFTSAVLGTGVVGEQSVSVDGHQVKDPKDPVVADSSSPTFSGYTIANAGVLLIISSDPIEAETLSDANGYWFYTMESPLEPGQHTLTLKITDSNGITSEETLAATFVIPEVKGEETTKPITTEAPLPKTPRINYLTISLIVLGSLVLLGAIYAFFSRKPR